jgi:hypothetical protein
MRVPFGTGANSHELSLKVPMFPIPLLAKAEARDQGAYQASLVHSGSRYLPQLPMPAFSFSSIALRLNEPGVWLGGYSCMV